MKPILKQVSSNAMETFQLGNKLGNMLRKGDVVLLVGDLGTGKTTLTKGIASSITGINPDDVTSPSFTIMHDYPGPVPVVHVDLYKLDDPTEIFELETGNIFQNSVVVIEWGEKVIDQFDKPYIMEIKWIDFQTREIIVKR